MKCPYCAKAISNEAVVCPFCQRDLAFFKPISERLWRIEHEVERLRKAIEESGGYSGPVIKPTDIMPTVALLLSILMAFLFTSIDWRPIASHQYDDWILEALTIGSPFIAALGLGVSGSNVTRSAYLLLGLIAGCAGLAQMVLLYSIGKVHESIAAAIGNLDAPAVSSFIVALTKHDVTKLADLVDKLAYTPALPTQWYWSFAVYPISGSLLFLSGGLAGERIRRLFSPSALRNEPSCDSGSGQGLEKWLNTLSPLLVGILGLITAVIGVVFHK
jgi:hypothetical protein